MSYTIFGGTLEPPIDLTIKGEFPVPVEDIKRNAEQTKRLGFKTYREARPPLPPYHLAVVGGGPSIAHHVVELQQWDGDIWAINGAFGWCREMGIDATLLACDPHPIVAKWAVGARKALLEVSCDPSAFDVLKDAEVFVFDCDPANGGIAASGSTATAAPQLACRMGYRKVTFFGCESCYTPEGTHAYQDEKRTSQLIIECDGGEYLTAPDLYIQAKALSGYIRELPEFLDERGGGLLAAMVKEPRFHIRWVSEELARNISRF